jgi:hypothetical protein
LSSGEHSLGYFEYSVCSVIIQKGDLLSSATEDKIMEMKMHHVGIVVDDIDRAKEVYEKVFGFEVAGRYMVNEFNADCIIAGHELAIEPFQTDFFPKVTPLKEA